MPKEPFFLCEKVGTAVGETGSGAGEGPEVVTGEKVGTAVDETRAHQTHNT